MFLYNCVTLAQSQPFIMMETRPYGGRMDVCYVLLSAWGAGFQVSLLPELKGTVPDALSVIH